jgi:hypothetical protein
LTVLSIVPLAVLSAISPSTVDAQARAAGAYASAYDGIWNVVFATTRGNCSSGYRVPYTVTGSRVSSAGGGQVSGSVGRSGSFAVNLCRRLQGKRWPPACRQWRRRLMARNHLRRPL